MSVMTFFSFIFTSIIFVLALIAFLEVFGLFDWLKMRKFNKELDKEEQDLNNDDFTSNYVQNINITIK